MFPIHAWDARRHCLSSHRRIDRRTFLTGSLGVLALAGLGSRMARAETLDPPMTSKDDFIAWEVKTRGETAKYLGERWDRFRVIVANKDVWKDADKRAFLMVPREEFVLKPNLPRAYASAFLDIGFGVTISGPHLVARMTSSLDVQPGDKVLEIGTGSGYQSAYLSNLTDKVWTIEIIKPLAERTRSIYDALIAKGYDEYKAIQSKNADGYYGWEEAAPFDKIIVTCGIDHIPPPLLKQLKPNGIMVIPVGPPGAQHVLKVVKQAGADGQVTVARSDIYNGRIVPFVPFTKLEGDVIKGTH
jgi:protein-L-isoaspartate(D-aspartate) O-methyltransferase